MKRTIRVMLLAITSLVLTLSACAKPQISETGAGEVSAVTADRTLPSSSVDRTLSAATTDRTATAAIAATPKPQPTENAEKNTQRMQEPPEEAQETQPEASLSELQIHFLDVGQGDCTLLLCGGEAMLIDAGSDEQGAKIQSYLRKQNVETLRYVVCTHPDEDHIGGMDVILYKFPCETILMTEEEKDTDAYRDVIDTMENRNYQRTVPEVGQQYSLGDAVFTILGPVQIDDDSNNNSIALLLTHGETRFLFTGDAEGEEEAAMLESGIPLDADVYKAGHHGSRTSSSWEFLEAVSPEYVVISCGEGNSYGHPHAETLNHLRALGAEVFRTDEQGSIVLYSGGSPDNREDGSGINGEGSADDASNGDASRGIGIRWNCSPSETWQAGEPHGSSEIGQMESASGTTEVQQENTSPDSAKESAVMPAENQMAPEAMSYVCNSNTLKFHYPDCSSVDKMKEKNKRLVTATRDELIAQGYEPCKRCKP